MLWGKKDDKQLPDLPPLKEGLTGRSPLSSPSHDDDLEDFSSGERHGLPSFPDSPLSRGFSQAAIKDAIVNDSIKDGEEVVGVSAEPKAFKVVEVEDESPLDSSLPLLSPPPLRAPPVLSSKRLPSSFSTSVSPSVPASVSNFSSPSARGSDVFVKIDRFNTARKALNAVQTQLESVDGLLKKIRETKLREEQEFSAWEKDMIQARSKIEEITKGIFDKTE